MAEFQFGGMIKAGGYWNHALESTGVSIEKVVHPTGASTDQAAFVGEATLQGKYQVTRGITLKLGYEALWLARRCSGARTDPGNL